MGMMRKHLRGLFRASQVVEGQGVTLRCPQPIRILPDVLQRQWIVGDDGVNLAVHQILEGQADIIIGLDRRAFDFLSYDVAGGFKLGANRLPNQVSFTRNSGFTHPNGDDLACGEVRLREVELLFALLGNGHGGNGNVILTSRHTGQQGIPGDILNFDLEALFLGNGLDQVHVEALDILGRFVDRFERRPGGVHGDGDFSGAAAAGGQGQAQDNQT